jgi:hypothetical protein
MKPTRYEARGAKKPAIKKVNSAGGRKKNWT